MMIMPDWTILDYILLAVLTFGILRGTVRGLSGELASIVSMVAASAAAWFLRPPLADLLAETRDLTALQAETAALGLILIAALVFFWACLLLLKTLFEFAFKGLLERIGGALIGGLRFALVLTLALLLYAPFASELHQTAIYEDSVLGRQVHTHILPIYSDLIDRYVLPPEPDAS